MNIYNLHTNPEQLAHYNNRYSNIEYLNSRLKFIKSKSDDWLMGNPFDDVTDEELYSRISYLIQDWFDEQESEFNNALKQIKPPIYLKIKERYQIESI